MKRRNLLKGIGTAGLLAVGVTTAAADGCYSECCQWCEQRDWSCDGVPCSCQRYCPYEK